MEKKEVKSKKITLNNSIRKGEYIYLKADNVPSRYYKTTGDPKEEEALKQYYNDKYIEHKTKAKHTTYLKRYGKPAKKTREYMQETSKLGSINENLNKGITSTTIPNLYSATQKEMNQAKETLISGLLKNKELTSAMIKSENQKKIAFRYKHQIIVKNEMGETLLEVKKYNMTLDKLKEELLSILPKGETYEGDSAYKKIKSLKNQNYQIQKKDGTGNLTIITVTTTLRKGV